MDSVFPSSNYFSGFYLLKKREEWAPLILGFPCLLKHKDPASPPMSFTNEATF